MCKNGSHDFLFASANLFATLLVPIHMARSHIVGDSKARTQVEIDTRAPHSGQGAEAEACIQDAISREVTLDKSLRVQRLLVTLYTIFSNSLPRPLLVAQTQ